MRGIGLPSLGRSALGLGILAAPILSIGGFWLWVVFSDDWIFPFSIAVIMLFAILAPLLLYWNRVTNRLETQIRSIATIAEAVNADRPGGRIPLEDLPQQLSTLARNLNQSWNKLENAYFQQSKFTSDASHELRTPLAVMRLKVELALSKERDNEEYRKTLEVVQDAAHRLQAILEALLLLSRVESGHISTEFHEVDLRALLAQTIEGFSGEADTRGVTIDWVPPPDPIPVRGDRVLLDRIFSNLVSNALRYGTDRGNSTTKTTQIRLYTDGVANMVRVRDFGKGIPVELRHQVFQRFFRVDAGRSRKTGGCGLGLALAQSLARLHHGRIWLENISGPGASFIVELPVHTRQPTPSIPIRQS